jgi:hypothetical protein
MANILYPKFKKNLQLGLIDMADDAVMVCLVDTDVYAYDAAHEFLSDLGASRVGTDQQLAGKSVSDSGVFDATDPTFPLVSGAVVEALVIYVDVGSPVTSYLVAYIDDALGLPATPTGADIPVVFDNGVSKIYAL